jgi:uncharacterized protein (TIGR03066 family)
MLQRSIALLLSFTITFVASAAAQEKKADEKKGDAREDGRSEKLVGSWEMQDADLAKIDGKATFEFTRDGKAKMSIEIGKQKPILIEGTYKMDGEKLTLVAKKGEKDASEIVTIKTASATELVLVDKDKKEVKFKKPEPKTPAKEPFPKSPFPKSPFPPEQSPM